MPWSKLLIDLDHNVECVKLDLEFNLDKLRKDIKKLDNAYVQKPSIKTLAGLYGKNKIYWLGIPLRNVGGDPSPEGLKIGESPNVTSIDCKDTIYLKNCSYIKEILDQIRMKLGTEIGQVRVLKLKVGGCLPPHIDYPTLFPERRLRLHIPVVTKPGVGTMIEYKWHYLEAAKLLFCSSKDT